ncbi:MAG: bacteriorhodopsin [Pelagibacteraceae bacterium]|jgi:bacteriorhodopsin|nr:bacteriorhodopsin [Pelagibacteraceae bacterium]MBO6492261.1 bacteriorhodopsin [Pelagibacteraceae bacterium]
MGKVKIIVIALVVLIGISSNAYAKVALLQPDDFVGFTFWLVSIACLATTAFFFLEHGSVTRAWKPSIAVAGIVTGITFIHSMYVGNIWVATGDSPIIYRYVDWLITIPLLTVQFYLVLSAVKKVSPILFWKFLIAPLAMVLGCYAGEAGYISSFLGFVIWMVGWIYILYEIFPGEVGRLFAKSTINELVTAFGKMRMIVTIGWTIYPLGYVFGYLTGGIDSNTLNVIYNFADFINKIAFGLVIWVAARNQY